MHTLVLIILAWWLDCLLGEPKRYHPLVYLGSWVKWVEARCYCRSRLVGVMAYGLVVLPLFVFACCFSLYLSNYLYFFTSLLCLYLAIAYRSLIEHVQRVANPLLSNDLPAAREQLSLIVSRDTSSANSQQITQGAIESLLENGNDAVFAACFWFVIAGLPGVVLYRVANTLDAMWGYKNERYLKFGWAAARVDDVLNFIPARMTALAYCLSGDFKLARRAWTLQGLNWKSPNAGPVMAAGAGSLGLKLGGEAVYDGQLQPRPDLGYGRVPQAQDINRAIKLFKKACYWVFLQLAGLIVLYEAFFYMVSFL